ncbi:MAG: hypothetical protein AAGJ40_22725 [Planctomycetota bacterium]
MRLKKITRLKLENAVRYLRKPKLQRLEDRELKDGTGIGDLGGFGLGPTYPVPVSPPDVPAETAALVNPWNYINRLSDAEWEEILNPPAEPPEPDNWREPWDGNYPLPPVWPPEPPPEPKPEPPADEHWLDKWQRKQREKEERERAKSQPAPEPPPESERPKVIINLPLGSPRGPH